MPFIGYGCDFGLSTDGGATYPTVGSVVEITHPPMKAGDIKTSNIQQAQPWHTFQAALADAGQGKFKLIYLKTTYSVMLTNFRVNNNFKLTFSDIVTTASTLVWAGYVNELGGAIPLDDMIVFDVGVKVSGKPTFTAGT